jgi:hypothetical protein
MRHLVLHAVVLEQIHREKKYINQSSFLRRLWLPPSYLLRVHGRHFQTVFLLLLDVTGLFIRSLVVASLSVDAVQHQLDEAYWATDEVGRLHRKLQTVS